MLLSLSLMYTYKILFLFYIHQRLRPADRNRSTINFDRLQIGQAGLELKSLINTIHISPTWLFYQEIMALNMNINV